MGLLLPLDARGRGRRRSSLPLSLSLLKLKKTPTQSPHLPKLWPVTYHDVEKTEGTCPFGGFWGGCTVAALASLSPIFPINIGKIVEKKRERKELNKRGKELKIERKKKRKTEEEKKKKMQRSRGKKKKDRRLEPPPFRHQHHRQRQQPLQVSSPLLFHLLILLLRLLLHCSRCMWTVERPTI